MFLKKKRSGVIKGRGCADGRKQRTVYFKEETTSSTYHNDSLMTILLIEAFEGRIVASGDVPGTYVHTIMKDFTVLKLTRESVESLCEAEPNHNKFVTIERA